MLKKIRGLRGNWKPLKWNFFHFAFRLSHGHLNMYKIRNRRKFELRKSIIYRRKGLEKFFSMISFSKKSAETITTKNLKLISNMVYVNEKFQVIVKYWKSLERLLNVENVDFFGIIVWNVDLNYYHLKPHTRYMTIKNDLINMTYYISLKRSWKKLVNGKISWV